MDQIKRNLILVAICIAIFAVLNFLGDKENPMGTTEKSSLPLLTAQQKPNPKDQILFIPKLGIWSPIVYGQSSNEVQLQLDLLKGIVHLPGTVMPGEVGNAYLVGSSSNHSWVTSAYNQVFADLEKLEAGDNVAVIDQSGQIIFEVTTIIIVPASDSTVTNQQTNGKRLLSLQAYSPTMEQRYVVVAELKN